MIDRDALVSLWTGKVSGITQDALRVLAEIAHEAGWRPMAEEGGERNDGVPTREFLCNLWHEIRGTADIDDWAADVLRDAFTEHANAVRAGYRRAPAVTQDARETARQIMLDYASKHPNDFSLEQTIAAALTAASLGHDAAREALRKVTIYRVDGDDLLRVKINGANISTMTMDTKAAQAMLQFDAEQRAALAGTDGKE